MALDTRGMARREWKQILRRRTTIAAMAEPGFHGYAGLMRIEAVSEPFVRRVTLADAGYTWLQMAPEDEHWWLTVMYDPEGTLIQYYFDITWRNFLSETGEPTFEDLYLDLLLQPDGSYAVLDRDELDAALAAGEITREQHALAVRALDELVSRVRGREPEWRARCARVKALLEAEEARQ